MFCLFHVGLQHTFVPNLVLELSEHVQLLPPLYFAQVIKRGTTQVTFLNSLLITAKHSSSNVAIDNNDISTFVVHKYPHTSKLIENNVNYNTLEE